MAVIKPIEARDISLRLSLLLITALLIGAFFVIRRNSTRLASGWERLMRRIHSRIGRMLMIAFGSQIGMLFLLAGGAAFVACHIGAAEWVLGVNFLFAITWTELLDVTEKLFEAAEEFEER